MERKMWPIEVTVDDQGFIRVSQDLGPFEEPETIVIHPDQVDLLIQWINAARDESQIQ